MQTLSPRGRQVLPKCASCCSASGPNRTASHESVPRFIVLRVQAVRDEMLSIPNGRVSEKAYCLCSPWKLSGKQLEAADTSSQRAGPLVGHSLSLKACHKGCLGKFDLTFFSQVAVVLIPIFRCRLHLRCTICWLT